MTTYNFRDLTDQSFERLTVLERGPNTRDGQAQWWCQCLCGTRVLVRGYQLRKGRSQSCGCLKKERAADAHTTHGLAYSPEYSVWQNIKARCFNPNVPEYKYYGGRGITMCEAWQTSFSQFLADMGPRPSADHTIERMLNDQGYFPENCIWLPSAKQTRNTRRNHYITIQGRTQCLAAWLEETGISHSTFHYRRAQNMSDEEALLTPPGPSGNKRHKRHHLMSSVTSQQLKLIE